MYKRMLVPLDGSTRAEKILPYVEEMAALCSAAVTLVRIVEIPPLVMGQGTGVDIQAHSRLVESLLDEAEKYLQGKCGELRNKAIECKHVVGSGPVVDGIITEAKKQQADIIALASHGRTGLPQVFYGSVAAGILQRAQLPLLIIRARATS
jgi:nucleotide-binding universal stress UspA family protein